MGYKIKNINHIRSEVLLNGNVQRLVNLIENIGYSVDEVIHDLNNNSCLSTKGEVEVLTISSYVDDFRKFLDGLQVIKKRKAELNKTEKGGEQMVRKTEKAKMLVEVANAEKKLADLRMKLAEVKKLIKAS